MAKIRNLMFFANGNVAAFDENGEQVPEEQVPATWIVMRDMLVRGVIDEDTKVSMPYMEDTTVGEELRRAENFHAR